MVVGLRQFTASASNGSGQPVLDTDNGEELVHVQPSVSIALGNRTPESPGTLYITTKQVVWLSDVDRTKGYAVDFMSLSLHSVSRDREAYHSPCIYTQIETEADEDESKDLDSECNEVLDLSKCAELNPEPIEKGEEEEHNWVFSADQLEDEAGEGDGSEWYFPQNLTNSIGHSNSDHELTRKILELQINDQPFEDAEEMGQVNDSSHHHQ